MRVNMVAGPGLSDVPVGGFVPAYQYSNRLARRGHEVHLLHGYGSRQQIAAAGLADLRGRPPDGFWFDIDAAVDFRVCTIEDALPDGDVMLVAGHPFLETPDPASIPPLATKGRVVILLQGFGLGEEDDLQSLAIPAPKIAVTRWIYELALSPGVSAGDIAYVPNAVDHGRFGLFRAIDGRPPRVAMLCNTRTTIKGAAHGIEALQRAKAQRPQLQAILFGTDAPLPDLPAWIEFRRLPSPDELVRDVYNRSAIYLCPSIKDSFHLPAPEAMACGCALVSTDLGVTEYAEPGVTALVSPRKDPGALAANIVRLIDDESQRVRIARAGRARVFTLSWDRSAVLLERFLARLCQR